MASSVTSIAQSGLHAAMRRLDSAAHNIANASTPGFRRQSVQLEAAPHGGGVVTQVQQADVAGGDLATDLVAQMTAAYAFKANLGVIETERAMLGALLDLRA